LPLLQVEVPNPNRRIVLAVVEQNRGNDWKRWVAEVAKLNHDKLTICVTKWPGNPVNHKADMEAAGIPGGERLTLLSR